MIIIKGFTRSYVLDEKEEEKTIYIASKKMMLGSVESLFLKKPSLENIVALEKTIVLCLDHFKMEDMGKTNIDLQKFKVKHLEKLVLSQQERIRFFSLLSAEQRYKYLVENNRSIMKNVSQKYLASYIGVTPVSFSRISCDKKLELCPFTDCSYLLFH